jgi:hypothetical protein
VSSETTVKFPNPYMSEVLNEVAEYRSGLSGSGIDVGPEELLLEHGDYSQWALALGSQPFKRVLLSHQMLLSHQNIIVGGGDEVPMPRGFRLRHVITVTLAAPAPNGAAAWANSFKVEAKVIARLPLTRPRDTATWSGNDCGTGLLTEWRSRYAESRPAARGLTVRYSKVTNEWHLRLGGDAPRLTPAEWTNCEALANDLLDLKPCQT